MKKLIFKIVFKFGIIIAVLMSVPYFMMGGRLPPWVTSLIPSMGSATPKEAKLPKNITSVTTDKEVTYYKWVDANGQTHFGSTPPIGQQAEQKKLRPDTNLVQAVKVPEPESDEDGGPDVVSLGGGRKPGGSDKDGGGSDEPFNPYTPDGLQKMFDGARDAAKTMDQRNRELGRITGAE